MLGRWRHAQFRERVESPRVLGDAACLWGIGHTPRRGDIARDVVQSAVGCTGSDKKRRVESRTRDIRVLHGESVPREIDFIVLGHSGFGGGLKL